MARRREKTTPKSLTAESAKKRRGRKDKLVRGSAKQGEERVLPKPTLSKTTQVGAAEHAPGPARRVAAVFSVDLSEDKALSALRDARVPTEQIERIFQNHALMKSRKVRMAAVSHPKASRRLSLSALRHLFTLDLMSVALTPAAPADIKRAAEEILMTKLESSAAGVRLTLARRGSGRIAAALLMDREQRVVEMALENPRLTEAMVAKAAGVASEDTVGKFCRHPKWSARRDIRIALLRSEHTPLARALEFARGISKGLLGEVLQKSRLPDNVKECLLASSS